MFMFGFRGYMAHAFPRDDLRPLSCRGHDTQGGFGNTLVDVLDTLVVSTPSWLCQQGYGTGRAATHMPQDRLLTTSPKGSTALMHSATAATPKNQTNCFLFPSGHGGKAGAAGGSRMGGPRAEL